MENQTQDPQVELPPLFEDAPANVDASQDAAQPDDSARLLSILSEASPAIARAIRRLRDGATAEDVAADLSSPPPSPAPASASEQKPSIESLGTYELFRATDAPQPLADDNDATSQILSRPYRSAWNL
ncbi:MAG: hypothetical protein NC098_01030 [Lachnoclostridium sp.]|nr:hypothetical protein [Lachnoclostridium sp.]